MRGVEVDNVHGAHWVWTPFFASRLVWFRLNKHDRMLSHNK